MDIWGMHSLSAERLGRTRIDRDILPANGCEDAACIGSHLPERGVAMNGTDAEQV